MTVLQAFGGSVRSPSDRQSRRPPTWDGAPATDFAITTVNVPDRLDVQEVRARAEEDDYSRRSWFSLDRYVIQLWVKRLLVLGVVGAAGYFALQAVEPLQREFSAPSIAKRLSAGLGQPVTIGDRGFRYAPTPRMVLTDVAVGSELRIPEVALHFNWNEVVRAARSGAWAWSEVEVAPLQLSAAQALGMLATLPKLGAALPASVSTLRFPALEFTDFRLLPGSYELVLRRAAGGRFGPPVLEQRQGEGSMRLALTPSDEGQGARFELEAQRWRAPVGPATPWADVAASGSAAPGLIRVDSFTVGGYFGVTQGALIAASDAWWTVTGTARSSGIDLESVMRHLQGAGSAEAGAGAEMRVPLQGTAALSMVVGGHGETLTDAIDQVVVSGPVQVRSAALNGINLGLAATQGGGAMFGSGGLTRFTELEASIVADRSGVAIRDITGRAGAMSTRGEVKVAPGLALSGALRVDLGAERVQAPLNLRVRGTALQPAFGK